MRNNDRRRGVGQVPTTPPPGWALVLPAVAAPNPTLPPKPSTTPPGATTTPGGHGEAVDTPPAPGSGVGVRGAVLGHQVAEAWVRHLQAGAAADAGPAAPREVAAGRPTFAACGTAAEHEAEHEAEREAEHEAEHEAEAGHIHHARPATHRGVIQ